ncbi:MAG TPA: hypothetical protein VLA29_12860 [Acidimicrobiia bacterium]|nr:hypothetical protein [Acidimicrobiia bacterium]
MDKDEARTIARSILDSLQQETYEHLVDGYLDAHIHREAFGRSGTAYQIEIDALWDSGEPGDIRVLVAIDDGGWSAFSPLVVNFIKAPDGSFVGDEV